MEYNCLSSIINVWTLQNSCVKILNGFKNVIFPSTLLLPILGSLDASVPLLLHIDPVFLCVSLMDACVSLCFQYHAHCVPCVPLLRSPVVFPCVSLLLHIDPVDWKPPMSLMGKGRNYPHSKSEKVCGLCPSAKTNKQFRSAWPLFHRFFLLLS